MSAEYVQVLLEGDLRTLKKQIKVLGRETHMQMLTAEGREVELSFLTKSGYNREGLLWAPEWFVEGGGQSLPEAHHSFVLVIGMESLKAAETQFRKLGDRSGSSMHVIAVTEAKVFNDPEVQALIYRRSQDLNMAVYLERPEELTLDKLKSNLRVWIPAWSEHERKRLIKPADSAKHPPYLKITQSLSDPATGRLDAIKLAASLGMTLQEMGAVCKVSKQSIHANPTSKGIQENLHVLEKIVRGLLWCGGDEAKFKAWLNQPNPDFPEYEGKQLSPLDLIRMGHAQVIADKVQNLLTGHPA